MNSTVSNNAPQGTWGRKPTTARMQVVLTLDQNGNPEIIDPRKRSGFYPYLQKGGVLFSSRKGVLIDVFA